MSVDAVIATYSRPASVLRLVQELKRCTPPPSRVVVVDSSDEVNETLAGWSGVAYLRSRHKNQPYQRYVGALAAQAPAVLFLDDDLYVEDSQFLRSVLQQLKRAAIVGVGVNFAHEGALPEVFGGGRNRAAQTLLRWHAALRRRPDPGALDLVGGTVGMPDSDGAVRFFRGGAMAFRREILEDLFDPVLFALFEKKLGMGEDKAISMRANRYGQLWWLGGKCLRHPPTQGSHYSDDPVRFLTKVLVSRLYLARVYCETFGKPMVTAYWAFLLELLRTLGSGLLRTSKEPGVARRAVLAALRIVLATRLRPERLAPGVDFWADAAEDVAAARLE